MADPYHAIYIPTRKREHLLPKVIAPFLPYQLPIFIVTDKQFVRDVKDALGVSPVEILSVAKQNRGIGYARAFIAEHAEEEAWSSYIMCDDDNTLIRETDLLGMLQFAIREDVLGVGAWKGTYSLFTGDSRMTRAAKRKREQAFLKAGGYGHMIFALNGDAMASGEFSFDPRLNAYEDDELERQGIAQGIPWYIYTACQARYLGPRYAPGGLSSHRKSRATMEKEAHEIIYKRWPEFISQPGKRFRCAWAKMVEAYIRVSRRPLEDVEAGST